MSIKSVFRSLFHTARNEARLAVQKAKKPPSLLKPRWDGFTLAGRKIARLGNIKKVTSAVAGVLGIAAAAGKETKPDFEAPAPTGSYLVERSHFTCPIPKSAFPTDSTVGIEAYIPVEKEGGAKRPCIVFSHGWETNPSAYQPLLNELASHGYVVLSVNHPSSSQPYPGPLAPKEENEIVKQRTFIQANHLRFVAEQIRSGAFKELGLSGQIVLAGHSMGGAASILASRADPGIAGCIDLDGGVKGDSKQGLKMPLLLILADHLKDQGQIPQEEWEEFQNWKTKEYDPMVQDWEELLRNSPHSRKEKIEGIGHMDFTLAPFQEASRKKQVPEAGLKAHQGASSAILKFMNSI